ncbi:single-stranded DNA-binding protein [Leucobacter allii]|uniref:single-stranded DNA-binding protein n=1 Tax=Leucobacter allii TaxID=2932247 RepID=UPI001FD4AB19|nr:single-stranded DNA-binding protein [Leucobacter allii]UOR02946.1 single-stranded DNA-binding protein [Leucobacter allii]
MSTALSIIGTVATEPRLITTSTRTVFCSFRVASNDRWYDREKAEWVDGATNWFTVNAFRTLAEHTLKSVQIGDRVVVSGRLRIRSWETDERSGTTAEVEADGIGHDLRWGTSVFTRDGRAARSGNPEGSGSSESPAPGEEPPASPENAAAGDGFVPVAA